MRFVLFGVKHLHRCDLYFRGDINRIYARYFADAGFKCLAMAGMDVDFDEAQELSSFEVYRFIKREFLAHGAAPRRSTCSVCPAWRTLDIVDMLEQDDLGVPVVHAIPAQCLGHPAPSSRNRQPVKGFGRLIAEMPDGPDQCR